ncbi:hypothetical protein RF11_16376 [Thelohanellus kitauei]|uniref:Uncharacterized protein n=1 Tax=Thelohanellus kitauei TaxID=669202 RepID=A0A0C2J3C8_THEKT|nr:hypothetical protein RF11_16376 [Thelohanellus kitauei]
MQIRSLVDTFHPADKPKTNDYPVLPSKYSFVKLNCLCYFKNQNLKEERSPRWLSALILKIIGNRHVLLKLRNLNLIKRHVEQLRPRYQTNDSEFMLYVPYTKQEDYQTAPRPVQNNTDERSIPRRSERIRGPPKRFQPAPWRRPKLKKRGVMYKS